MENHRNLKGKAVVPRRITGQETARELLLGTYPAFVGRDLRNAYDVMRRSIDEGSQVFMTLSGAMVPAGLHLSAVIPLIEAGLIGSLTTTGANLYHDLHRVLGDAIHEVNPHGDDLAYRQDEIIRIYDLGFDEEALYKADRWFTQVFRKPEFQKTMGIVEMNWLLGREVAEFKAASGATTPSLLETCHKFDVPVFVGAPQDGSIFLALAALRLKDEGITLRHDGILDVFDMAGLQHYCHRTAGKTAIWIFGGGVPKNFTLQGEPMVTQFLQQEMQGFDFDVQFCVDVVDNGALSSCPAGEAHTWGKTSAECIQHNSVYCRTDVTVAAPLVTAALLEEEGLRRVPPRLYRHMEAVREEFRALAQSPTE